MWRSIGAIIAFLLLSIQICLAQEVAPEPGHGNHGHGVAEEQQPATDSPAQPSAEQPAPETQPAPTAESVAEVTPDTLDTTPMTFEGLVLNPNGIPVAGATVEIPELQFRGVSAKGGIIIIQVPPGTYTVMVTAKGFETLEETLDLDEGVQMTGFELMLEFRIEDVVVTGTKTERLVEQAPVRTQVIDRKDIERKQADNLADALDNTTGVRTEMNCQNCGFTQIRLNGLEGQYTQILIDGNPVVSSLAAVYLAEQIPEEMIERVEVVKGGGSALYGGNAVGGVVNIITRKPYKDFAGVLFRGGGIGLGTGESSQEYRLSANGGVVSKDRDMALHVFAGMFRRDEWDANDDGFSEIGRVRQLEGGASAFLELLPGTELQLKFHALREHRRGGDNIDKPEHDAATAESIRSNRLGFDTRWKHWVTGDISYEMGYGLAFTERNSYYGGGGDVDPWALLPDDHSDFTDQTWVEFTEALNAQQAALNAYGTTRNLVHTADLSYNHHFTGLGDHILTVGAQFSGDDLEDSFPGYNREHDEFYWNVAGFAQHNWIWGSWGEWVLGLRVDKHSELADPVPNPRVALKISPLHWLKLRTSFATGFRAPQIFDEDLHITIMGGEAQSINNDAGLEAEKSYSISQQVSMNGPVGNGWRLTGGVNGFYTVITDMFALDMQDDPATPNQLEFVRVNGGKAQVYGGELEFGVSYRDIWELNLGMTLEKAENDEADPDFGSKELFRTPGAYGYLATFVQPVKGLEIATSLDITGPMKVPHYEGNVPVDSSGDPIPQLEESPWFVDWDASIAYRWNLSHGLYLKPFLGIKNILNAYQDDFDTGADRDAGYVYGPRSPRTVYGGIKGGF